MKTDFIRTTAPYFKKCDIACLTERYGSDTYTHLKNCPYKLAIDGAIDFGIIDNYVMKSTKISALCPARIAAAMHYSLVACQNGSAKPVENSEGGFDELVLKSSGSTCILKSRMYDFIELLLGLPEGTITLPMLNTSIRHLTVAGMVTSKRVGPHVYLATNEAYNAESEAAEEVRKKLVKTAGCRRPKRLYRAIDSAMAATGKILSQEQKNAVAMILQNRLSVLTGGPGTGKTQTELVLIEALRILDPNATVRCIAPTGQAARRMTQATGCPATTIHKALNIVPGITKAEEIASLTEDLIIVDEASMIDAFLFRDLMKSVSEKSTIVFVGDVAQLPSVGAGNTLAELIRSESVPVTRLTKIFRQGDNSIAFNCAKIQAGNAQLDLDSSFAFVERSSSEDIRDEVVKLYTDAVKKNGIDSVCCLTPYRRNTETGVNSLNTAIRSRLHDTRLLPYCENENGIRIYAGDKITFLRNRNGLVNGETGTAVRCDKGIATCRFGEREITLKRKDLSYIEPAFAQTVHKAQGLEYPTCIIVLDSKHSNMLTKEIIYTAISRSKVRCILVGQKGLLKRGIYDVDKTERTSCLAQLIDEPDSPENDGFSEFIPEKKSSNLLSRIAAFFRAGTGTEVEYA